MNWTQTVQIPLSLLFFPTFSAHLLHFLCYLVSFSSCWQHSSLLHSGIIVIACSSFPITWVVLLYLHSIQWMGSGSSEKPAFVSMYFSPQTPTTEGCLLPSPKRQSKTSAACVSFWTKSMLTQDSNSLLLCASFNSYGSMVLKTGRTYLLLADLVFMDLVFILKQKRGMAL